MSTLMQLRAGLSVVFLAAAAGCGAAPDADPGGPPLAEAEGSLVAPVLARLDGGVRGEGLAEAEDSPGDALCCRRDLGGPIHAAPDLLAWTLDGDLAIVDGDTGAVRHATPTLALGGGRDVVYDETNERAWVAELDDDGATGEIASYPVVTGPFGRILAGRTFEATTTGDTRLLACPLGPVAFEGKSVTTWRLLAGDAAPARPAPQPTSAWMTLGVGTTTVHALAYGPSTGELDVVTAKLKQGMVGSVLVEPLGVASSSLPPCARLAPAPARHGALLLDIDGSFLTVRSAPEGPSSSVSLGAMGLRIEAVVSLEGGAIVAALISGVTQVMAFELGPTLAVVSVAKVALPGQVAPSLRSLSHDLVRQGRRRVAATTSAGVFSIMAWRDPLGVHLALAPAFDGGALRGPIATL